MHSAPFSFYHYSPIDNWLRLLKSYNWTLRVAVSVTLFSFLLLHVVIVHLAYITVQTNPKFVALAAGEEAAPDLADELNTCLNCTDDGRLRIGNGTIGRTELPNGSRKWKKPRSPSKVVVVTYDQGEPGMLVKAVDQCPRSFCWREPLRHLYSAANRKYSIAGSVTAEGYDVRGLTPSRQSRFLRSEAVAAILLMLNCNLTSLSRHVLVNNDLLPRNSSGLDTYKECVKQFQYFLPATTGDQCRPLLTKACLRSNIRLVKISGLSLSLISRILAADLDVNVVHVIRDPRSLLEANGVNANALRRELPVVCEKLRQDLNAYGVLKQRHPGRLVQIKHRQLVSEPYPTIKRLFRFVDLPCPFDDVDLSPEVNDSGSYDVTDRVRKWRRRLPSLREAEVGLRECHDVLEHFGYRFWQ